jgi:predicted kinase
MVGLPARGKTYISRKVCRYLNWLQYQCKVFNVENYRRQKIGTELSPDFFCMNNGDAQLKLEESFEQVLEDMKKYLLDGGQIAILDGTNISIPRRQKVKQFLSETKVEPY